jgi:hypothetical protein
MCTGRLKIARVPNLIRFERRTFFAVDDGETSARLQPCCPFGQHRPH